MLKCHTSLYVHPTSTLYPFWYRHGVVDQDCRNGFFLFTYLKSNTQAHVIENRNTTCVFIVLHTWQRDRLSRVGRCPNLENQSCSVGSGIASLFPPELAGLGYFRELDNPDKDKEANFFPPQELHPPCPSMGKRLEIPTFPLVGKCPQGFHLEGE